MKTVQRICMVLSLLFLIFLVGSVQAAGEAVAWASGYGNLKYFNAKHPFLYHPPPFGSFGHFGGYPGLFPGISSPGFPSGGFPSYPSGGFPSYPSGGFPSNPSGGFPGYPNGGFPSYPSGDVPGFLGVPPLEAVASASGYGNLKYFDAKHPFLYHPPPFGSFGHFGGYPGLFPGSSGPEFPSGGFPSYPNGGFPSYPSSGFPGYPSGGFPSYPSGGVPGYPSGGVPGYPGGGFPSYPSGGVLGFPSVSPLETVASASGYGNLKYSDAKHPFLDHPPPSGSFGHFEGYPGLFPGGSSPGFPSGGFPGYPSNGFPSYPSGGFSSYPSGGFSSYPSGGFPSYPSGGFPGYPSGGILGFPGVRLP